MEEGNLVWQTERLPPIAIAYLPPECEAVVLIDADILIPEATWPDRLYRELERMPLVQPFREVHHLPPRPPKARAAFLAGYSSSGGPAEFGHHAFWLLLAHVTYAWFRARHDPANAAVPLQELQAWQSCRRESRG